MSLAEMYRSTGFLSNPKWLSLNKPEEFKTCLYRNVSQVLSFQMLKFYIFMCNCKSTGLNVQLEF